jgi:YcaO-like protein with predicted kinase domain
MPYKEVYSIRIENDHDQGFLGANGKGRDKKYALASAYAEYVERLQNKMITASSYTRVLLEKLRDKTGYYYYPDERIMTKEEFYKLPNNISEELIEDIYNTEFINLYFNRLSDNGYKGCLSVPFYDVTKKKNIYLPYNLLMNLSGSNGMAAGNTISEAIYQALCEILERYAAGLVFFNRLTPPTIERHFIEKHFPQEYLIIKNIEENLQFKVSVKDFSAGCNYPVLGVLIINNERNLYKLNVGSDLNFQVALSRCLTEIHQGIGSEEEMIKHMLQIPQKEYDYFLNNSEEDYIKRKKEYVQFTVDNKGLFPKSLFNEIPSYNTNHVTFNISNDTFEKDNKYLMDLLQSNDHNIYIRNVSFLGFPSVFIYIPILTNIGVKNIGVKGISNDEFSDQFFKDPKLFINEDILEDLFFPFENISSNSLKKITELLKNAEDDSFYKILKIDLLDTTPFKDLPISYFLTLSYFYLEEYQSSLKFLKKFILYSKNIDNYYRVIQSYIQLLINKVTKNDLKESLSKEGYENNLITEVCRDLFHPKDVFKYFHFPNCPNCDNCKLNSFCVTKDEINLLIRTNNKMQCNQIEQIVI